MKKLIAKAWQWFNKFFEVFIPLGDLIVRIWLARIFFFSGLTKIQSWQTTEYLFAHEYKVPLLSPYWAAVSGTAVELCMPVLLLLGLGGRIPALTLFVFNIVAVVSYPFLFTDAGAAALKDHLYWGLLLMLLMLYGTSKLSVDYVIEQIYKHFKP